MPHGEDTARDFCSYPFQGFDVDGRCCYLFEGAGNGNKPANGPSDARITVTTLDGGIVHWRLPVGAYSDLEGLRALGLTDTGYAEAEGIKCKGGRCGAQSQSAPLLAAAAPVGASRKANGVRRRVSTRR